MADNGRPIFDAPIQWDATGPYYPTTTGGKSYVPPAQAAQAGKYRSADLPGDPRLLQWGIAHGASPDGVTVGHDGLAQSYLHNTPEWNPQTGAWDQGINWNNILATAAGAEIGAGAINAFTTPAALGPSAAPAAATPAAAAPAAALPAAAPAAGLPAAAVPAAASTPGVIDRLQHYFSDPGNIARTAGMAVPLFAGAGGSGGAGGDSPFNPNGALMQGVSQDMALSRQRQQQAQPSYDALVNMAYGRTPTQYRAAAAPASYSGDVAPAGAYAYQAPRFS